MFLWFKKNYYTSIIFVLLIIDQITKFLVKTNMCLKGETISIFNFIEICFAENKGVAFGWLGTSGDTTKIVLTLLRIIILIILLYYLKSLIYKNENKIIIISISLIIAGAFGNIIDSIFYGILFNASPSCEYIFGCVCEPAQFLPQNGGYAGLLKGEVVDMIRFTSKWPEWFPFNLSNKDIFRPIFNVADSSICVGAFLILFNKKKK